MRRVRWQFVWIALWACSLWAVWATANRTTLTIILQPDSGQTKFLDKAAKQGFPIDVWPRVQLPRGGKP